MNISIVLVEPQGPRNIGSICRVMQNFNFSDLRLVNPEADYLSDEARHMAVKSDFLLDTAKVFSSLKNAVADCQFVVGSTRRFGKYRDNFLTPEMVKGYVDKLPQVSKIAIVFGREDHGLSTNELDMCNVFLTIPTNEALPSMNLAQAVTICLYEIHKSFGVTDVSDKIIDNRIIDSNSYEAMMQHMKETLGHIGYLNHQNPDHILRAYRRIFGRAGLTERDVRIIQGLLSKIDWLADQVDSLKEES